MRVHITLTEDELHRLDARVGSRKRSRFIAESVRRALDDEERWESIESAISALPDTGHEWDGDAASWVRSQRRADADGMG